jgi:Protein of unknown function (DUF2442)
MLRIRSARALDGYRVRLTLTNGDTVERDLTDIIWGPVFEPLIRDYARFRQVQVEAGTLTWPGELDFDPDTLIWGGAPPSELTARPTRFLKLERRSPAPTG